MKWVEQIKPLNDILKQGNKYSQGRIYLFWSILAFYCTLIYLTYAGITNSDIKIERFELILDALEYAMTLFGGYVFGGKFVDIIRKIKNIDKNERT